jgi:hypothetical protein
MFRFLVGVSCAIGCAAFVPTRALTSAGPTRTNEIVAAIPTEPDFTNRATLVAALERLMLTGEPFDTSHDDGQLLEWAVNAAIEAGDSELERLAIRAATPLIPSASPLLWADQDPIVSISPNPVLHLRRSIPYEARVAIALDDGPFRTVGTATDRRQLTAGRDILLASASAPGIHSVRARAQFIFGGSEGPSWTETRELPLVTYASYRRDVADDRLRLFIESPGRMPAKRFDDSLPAVPLGQWLDALVAQASGGHQDIGWMPMFCEMRTTDGRRPMHSGPVWSVAAFVVGGNQVWLWFRTGHIGFSNLTAVWTLESPTLEAVSLFRGGSGDMRLSDLGALLQTPRTTWPEAGISLSASDIVLTPLDAKTNLFRVDVSPRNTGGVDVHGWQVVVSLMSGDWTYPATRSFTRDIPRGGSASVTFTARFPNGYGIVEARALPGNQHGAVEGNASDSADIGGCATRVVNPDQAPATLRHGLRSALGCGGW